MSINFVQKVVFITLYYNRSKEVDVTLQSMIAAKTEGVHIIAVDDGSTDDTYQQLLKYKEQGVEVITGENKGFSKKLSEILRKVNSEYIAICGSGDICHKDRIITQLNFMEKNKNVVFCATASRNIDADTKKIVDYQNFRDGYLARKDFNASPPFTHGSVMMRTSAYKEVGGYDEKFYFCQDWDLWLRLLKVGDGYFINKDLYDRRLLLDGASFNAKKTELQLVYKYLALYFDEYQEVDRDLYLKNFNLRNIIRSLNLEKKIRRDMSSRYVKLIIIKDFKGANEIREILNKSYGGVLFEYNLVFYLIYFPVKFNLGVSVLSKALRFLIDSFRQFKSK